MRFEAISEIFQKKKDGYQQITRFLYGGVEISAIELDFDDFKHLRDKIYHICPDVNTFSMHNFTRFFFLLLKKENPKEINCFQIFYHFLMRKVCKFIERSFI